MAAAHEEQTDPAAVAAGAVSEADTAGDLRRARAELLISYHVDATFAAGLIPVPAADFAVVTGSQVNMICRLAALYGIEYKSETARNVVTGLLGASMPAALSRGMASMAKAIPGIGTFAGLTTSPILSAATTYAIGSVVVRHFEGGGTLQSFNPRTAGAQFREALGDSKRFLARRARAGKDMVVSGASRGADAAMKVFGLLLCLTLLQGVAFAQAPAAPAQQGEWWEVSSLALGGPTPEVRVHTDFTGSLMGGWGNVDGHTVDAGGQLVLRKQRVTSRLTASGTFKDIVYGPGEDPTNQRQENFREQVELDLNARFMVVAGVDEHRDSTRYLDHQTSVYGGLGIALLHTAQTAFSAGAMLGRQWYVLDEEGLVEALGTVPPDIDTFRPKSGAIRGEVRLRHRFQNHITMSHTFTALYYTNRKLEHTVDYRGGLEVPLSTHWSLAPQFRYHFEENVYTTAMGVKPTDRVLVVGIKVSY